MTESWLTFKFQSCAYLYVIIRTQTTYNYVHPSRCNNPYLSYIGAFCTALSGERHAVLQRVDRREGRSAVETVAGGCRTCRKPQDRQDRQDRYEDCAALPAGHGLAGPGPADACPACIVRWKECSKRRCLPKAEALILSTFSRCPRTALCSR